MQKRSFLRKAFFLTCTMASAHSFAMNSYTFLKLTEPKPYELIVRAQSNGSFGEHFTASIKKNQKKIQHFNDCQSEGGNLAEEGLIRIYCHSDKSSLDVIGDRETELYTGYWTKEDGTLVEFY